MDISNYNLKLHDHDTLPGAKKCLRRHFQVLLNFLKLHLFNGIGNYITLVLTTHRLAYLCHQCVASLDVKLALIRE